MDLYSGKRNYFQDTFKKLYNGKRNYFQGMAVNRVAQKYLRAS